MWICYNIARESEEVIFFTESALNANCSIKNFYYRTGVYLIAAIQILLYSNY